MKKLGIILSTAAVCVAVCTGGRAESGPTAVPAWPQCFPDPTVWQAPDGTWRATSTMRRILKSADFTHWEDTGKSFFSGKESKRIRSEWRHVWAPDVFRLGNRYLLYVSLVNAATNSAIAVYSSTSPEGPFTGGKIVTDGRKTGIADTIDPEAVRDDRDGSLWLYFGSIGKIHRVRLTPDGLSVAPGARYEHMAGLALDKKSDPMREKVFEGAYLHRRNGWWYLFASKGCYWNHTYSVVVGRAKTLDGPFLDRTGRPMTEGCATTVISSKKGDRLFGPGHNGEIVRIGDRDLLPLHCHVKGKRERERPLFIATLSWDDEGWPSATLGTE